MKDEYKFTLTIFSLIQLNLVSKFSIRVELRIILSLKSITNKDKQSPIIVWEFQKKNDQNNILNVRIKTESGFSLKINNFFNICA